MSGRVNPIIWSEIDQGGGRHWWGSRGWGLDSRSTVILPEKDSWSESNREARRLGRREMVHPRGAMGVSGRVTDPFKSGCLRRTIDRTRDGDGRVRL